MNIKPQLYSRRNFIDVLPAGPTGTDGAELEVGFGEFEFGHLESRKGAGVKIQYFIFALTAKLLSISLPAVASAARSVYPVPVKNSIRIILLLLGLTALYPIAVQGKESAITEATAYVIRGEPINVDAVAINEELSPQKPLTLLVWRSASRRWASLGSSHSAGGSGFVQVTGNNVLFTYMDTQSLDPGANYFGTTRSCTANGICPQDVEPDAAVRVIVALENESE